jgi:hypothetical protein
VSLTEIEHAMIRERKKTQDAYIQRAEYGVAFMDIPPYNAETEMMFPVVTKLFNLPSSFIKLDSFLMQDPISGETYRPGESPGM